MTVGGVNPIKVRTVDQSSPGNSYPLTCKQDGQSSTAWKRNDIAQRDHTYSLIHLSFRNPVHEILYRLLHRHKNTASTILATSCPTNSIPSRTHDWTSQLKMKFTIFIMAALTTAALAANIPPLRRDDGSLCWPKNRK